MKKVLYIASVLLAGAMITMYSCTKENDINNSQESKEIGLSLKDLKINNLIKDFKEDLAYYRKNPNIKDGESKSVDSAVWLLESTLNYSHSFAGEVYTKFEVDTTSLTVSKNANGEVNMTELALKYDELKTKVSAEYYDTEFAEKGLNGIILNKKSEDENNVEVEAVVYTGRKGIEPDPPNPILDGPFEEGDDWWYGENAGQCDAPGIKASDAAEELKIALTATIPDPNGQYFFINPVEYTTEGGLPFIQTDDTPDNYLDYYLYFASTEVGVCDDEVLCVEWTEMNHYYQRGKYLMFTFLPQNVAELEGKTIDELLVMHDLYSASGSYPNIIEQFKHQIVLKYGDKIGQDDPPTEIK